MKSLSVLLLFILCLFNSTLFAQQKKDKPWCLSKCDLAGDEKQNSLALYQYRDSMTGAINRAEMIRFPLRIGVVINPDDPKPVSDSVLHLTLDILNEAFRPARIHFDLERIDVLESPYKIEDLSDDLYAPYSAFSAEHDLEHTISLYLFDYEEQLCQNDGVSISCGRRGGFSYVLSNITNNVVLSKFDLEDHKIIVHEFGHFFGLYHTFETHQFGKELPTGENCEMTGDRICDTPADPGALYEVYVNYSKCAMIGNEESSSKTDYHPMINNYMAYYKPCYLRKYRFSPIQLKTIYASATMPIRVHFSR